MESARRKGKGPASRLVLACVLLFASIGSAVGGCSSAQVPVGGAEPMAPQPGPAAAPSVEAGKAAPAATEKTVTPSRYVIQPGDTLQIKFLYHPYFNDTLPVRPDGRISLQLIQDVPAAGLTPGQLRWYLSKKYEKIIENPELTVTVKGFSERPAREDKEIYVGGEVVLPKKLTFRESLTVLQAVYEVGGFKDSANLNSVIVIRNIAGPNREVVSVDMEGILEGNLTDFPLKDTDVIYVPRTFIAQADVFVDQYLNRIVPRWVVTGFSFTYPLAGTQNTVDIKLPGQGQ